MGNLSLVFHSVSSKLSEQLRTRNLRLTASNSSAALLGHMTFWLNFTIQKSLFHPTTTLDSLALERHGLKL